MALKHRSKRSPQKAGGKFDDAAMFLKTWAKKPFLTGSITPSSVFLSRKIASYVDPSRPGPVIEIGPGTGPTTQALIKHGVSEERLVLIEFYGEFCDLLSAKYPKARIVQGDAFALKKTLDGVLSEPAAAVVCGLPLLTRPEAVRLDLLLQAFEILAPGAPFIQYTYAASSPIPLKDASFVWQASPRIWRNMPPARVWAYRRPAAA